MASFQDPGNSSGQPGGSLFLDRLTDRIKSFAAQLRRAVTNDIIVTAALSSTPTTIRHGLGSPPTAWDIVDQDANAVVWRVGAATLTSLTLQASAPVNVRVRLS